jgi:NAD(P)-dependent dehydrogenase (short-subunit alcohol dehydrogenase family)
VGTGRLAGEVAIVTGSTSGLGRATARRFGLEGAQVVVTGRHLGRGRAVVEEITGLGGEADFVAADLGDEDGCRHLVQAAFDRFGSVTVLVNNAVAPEAIAADRAVTDLSAATLDRLLRVNLMAPALLCKHAIPKMLTAGHGAIVNIGATSGAMGTGGLPGYSMSKGGLAALSRVVAADYGHLGIRCNTVQSGYIIHEGREPNPSPERVAALKARQLTRLAAADDIVHAIVFLASREADVITGVILPVDGGATAARPKHG